MKMLLFSLPLPMLFLSGCGPAADQGHTQQQTVAQQSQPPQESDCLIESQVGFNQITVDKQLTAHCKERIAQGWRLISAGSGNFIWVK